MKGDNALQSQKKWHWEKTSFTLCEEERKYEKVKICKNHGRVPGLFWKIWLWS